MHCILDILIISCRHWASSTYRTVLNSYYWRNFYVLFPLPCLTIIILLLSWICSVYLYLMYLQKAKIVNSSNTALFYSLTFSWGWFSRLSLLLNHTSYKRWNLYFIFQICTLQISHYVCWNVLCPERVNKDIHRKTEALVKSRKRRMRWPNVGLLLGQRLRRWPSSKPTLVDPSHCVCRV